MTFKPWTGTFFGLLFCGAMERKTGLSKWPILSRIVAAQFRRFGLATLAYNFSRFVSWPPYHRPHVRMYCTSTWSSHSERSSGLPSTRRQPSRLRRLWVVLVPVLPVLLIPFVLLVGEQRGSPEQWVQQQHK